MDLEVYCLLLLEMFKNLFNPKKMGPPFTHPNE
jgi:hypothetical protein